MRLLAALCAGFLGFAGMGYLLGVPLRLEVRARPRRRSRADRRRQWLRQAGVPVSVAGFYAASALAGLAVFALLAVLTGAWLIALVPAALCALAPQAYYGRLRRERLSQVVQAWPDGLRDLATSIDARMSLHEAVLALARSGPEPLRRAFGSYRANAAATGVTPALEHVKAELADPTSDRVLEVLILAAERGAREDFREVLNDLAEDTAEDLRTNEDIETARLEPKLDSRVVAVMPWLLVLYLCLTDGPFRDFYGSLRPLPVLVVMTAATLTATGVLLIRHLSRDPVEARVLVDEAADD